MTGETTASVATSNGYEIQNPTEKMDAQQLRAMLSDEFHIGGSSSRERLEQLKQLSHEGIAIMLEAINKGLQGSEDSLMNHDSAMRLFDAAGNVAAVTLAPEDRYDVFVSMIDGIKAAPDDINPARVADTLALGTVLLHPFHDGNGRTARVVASLFRESYDNAAEYADDFQVLTESRDAVRARGGFVINGYTPHLPEGADQSNPDDVKTYLHTLLTEEGSDSLYTGCYGKVPLKIGAVEGGH